MRTNFVNNRKDEKIRKGFSEDLDYTEIGIKHVMGVLFWDKYESFLNDQIPDTGLRKQKRYPGKILIDLASKWNRIKKSDLILKAEISGQGCIKMSIQELVDYLLEKISKIKKDTIIVRYHDIFSLLCNFSPATRYEIKGNQVEFYEYDEEYSE